MIGFNKLFKKNRGSKVISQREPIKSSNLLLIITISVFALLYITSMISFGKSYATLGGFLNLFNENGAMIMIACGLCVVMITGGIDISVGAVTIFSGMVCVALLQAAGLSPIVVFILSPFLGLAFGALQGYLISYLKIQPFIVTLAGMFLARGLTLIVSAAISPTGRPSTISVRGNLAFDAWRKASLNLGSAKIELGVFIAIAILVIIFVVLRWTKFGRNVYAVGGNSQNALTLGINVNRTKFYSYMLCGAIAGMAGFVYLLHVGSISNSAFSGSEMKAIAAAIIGGVLLTGGVGNVFGSMFGVLSLGLITIIVPDLKIGGEYWTNIIVGIMVLAFIIVQSLIVEVRKRRSEGILKPKASLINTRVNTEI